MEITDEMAQMLIRELKKEEQRQEQKQSHQRAIDRLLGHIEGVANEATVHSIRWNLQQIEQIDNADI